MAILKNLGKRAHVMASKNTLWLFILSIFVTACSSGFNANNLQTADRAGGTNTQKGISYLMGRGVQQNDEKAFYYFSQAANANDVTAQNEVAYMYAAGKGTPQDYKAAFDWYQKAAEKGLASAQYNLGMLYQYGLGTDKNMKLANEWYQKSAASGFEPAKLALGRNQS